MYLQVKNRQVRLGRRLGMVSMPVAGSMVFGSDPIVRPNFPSAVLPGVSQLRYPVGGPPSAIYPVWGAQPPIRIVDGMGPTGILTPAPVPGTTPLQQAQQTLKNNPSTLTQSQWLMLQASGDIPGTLPYSSASLVQQSGGSPPATDTTTPASSGFDVSTALQTAYAGVPLYLWLLGAGGAWLLFGGSGKRR